MRKYQSLSVKHSALAKLRAMAAVEGRSMCRVLELSVDCRIEAHPTGIRDEINKRYIEHEKR